MPSRILDRRGGRLAVLGLATFLVAFAFPWTVAGLAGLPPLLARLAGAGLVTALVLANALVIARMVFELQVLLAFAELLLASGLFFWSFGLDAGFVLASMPDLLGGAALTVGISLAGMTLAGVLGLSGALGRLSGNGLAFGLATFYGSFFRGTPVLLHLLLIYLGLREVGLALDAVAAGIIALALCHGAALAAVFEAGIEAVGRGQREAALSLGLRPFQLMRLVILPQAMRRVILPTGSQFGAMLKDSALVSVIGVGELLYRAGAHAGGGTRYLEMLVGAALIYWLLSVALTAILSRIERRHGSRARP